MHRSSAPVAALLLAVNLLALVGSVGAFVTSAALTQQTPPPSPSRTSLASAPAETDDSPALTTTADQGDEDGGNGNLSPFLKDLVVERRGFELNLGKAMDVLRKDYPYMLRESPDFSIYRDDIQVVDPSGVQLNGLRSYRASFKFLRSVLSVFFDLDRSVIQSRMIYDWSRSAVRVSWNVLLIPRVVGNRKNASYLDGVSVYKLDGEGMIMEHKVERLVMNDTPIRPPYGIGNLLDSMMSPSDQRVPVGVGAMITSSFNNVDGIKAS